MKNIRSFLSKGGFSHEYNEGARIALQAEIDQERAKKEQETTIEANNSTIALNKDILRYAKFTRGISVAAVIISLMTLIIAWVQSCA